MPQAALVSPAPPDPRIDVVIDHILHEVRRAARAPVWQIRGGQVAMPQAFALAFGWLCEHRDRRRLVVTDSGLKALAAHQWNLREWRLTGG